MSRLSLVVLLCLPLPEDAVSFFFCFFSFVFFAFIAFCVKVSVHYILKYFLEKYHQFIIFRLCLGSDHGYSKCTNISYTKLSDKIAYANSADPDQTAH